MPNKKESIHTDFMFTVALLERPKDIEVLDIMRKEKVAGKKEIFVKLK